MSQQQQQNKPGPTVAVVGAVETPVGQHLARMLARGDYADWVGDVSGLMEQSQQQSLRPVAAFLSTQSVRVVPVNYNEVASIEQALRGQDWLVLVPPMLAGSSATPSPQSCVQEVQRVVGAAKKANVSNAILVSYVGCDAAPERKWLSVFKEAERAVMEAFGPQQCVVLRLGMPAQALRFAAPQVRAKRMLEWPIKPEQAFNPVDLDDVARAIAGILRGGNTLDRSLRGQTLAMFGPQAVNGKRIGQLISDMVQPIVGGQAVHWREPASRDDLASRWCQEQRRSLDKIIAASGQQQQQQQASVEAVRGMTGGEVSWCNALGPFYLTPSFAGIILDLCELANDGKLAGQPPQILLKQQPETQPWRPVERSLRESVVEWI